MSRFRLATVLIIALALVLAACTPSSQGGAASGDATIRIASPADGATVGIPFDVTLESSVPLGEPESGNHHAHLYFDTGTDATDYDIVYGNTWQVTRPLSPGRHMVTVALANPDHSLAGPTQSITLDVGPSGGGSSPAPSTGVPGY